MNNPCHIVFVLSSPGGLDKDGIPTIDNQASPPPLPLSDFTMGKDYMTVGHYQDEADQHRLRSFVSWARDETSRARGWPRVPQFKKDITLKSNDVGMFTWGAGNQFHE